MKKAVYFLIIFTSIISAQKYQTFTLNKPSALINEIIAVVVSENNKIIVDMVAPNEGRSEEYKKVDLQKGDEILYVNGNKINNLEEFKKAYGGISKGSEVKLGVSRKGNKFFVSFKRGDGTNIGKKIIKIGPDGKATDGNGKTIKEGKLNIYGKTINVDSLRKEGKTKVITK